MRGHSLLFIAVASALRATPTRSPPQSRAPIIHKPQLATFLPLAALQSSPLPAFAATASELSASGDGFNWYVEVNRPPIELSPFHINPVGYVFIAMYVGWLGWKVFGPDSEEEKAYNLRQKELAEAAAANAPVFLEEAKAAEGAQVTATGLIYRELLPGSGSPPSPDDSVKVHYTGKLCDGTVFDSSIDRGEPATFKVGQVIKGWQEGLQLMTPGAKALLTIPSGLAYGQMSMGAIPGNSALQFEVELIEIVKADEKKFGLF